MVTKPGPLNNSISSKTGKCYECIIAENLVHSRSIMPRGRADAEPSCFIEKSERTRQKTLPIIYIAPETFWITRTVCVCVFFPFILDIKFVGRTSRGHTGGRSHMIFYPPSFCGACLDFSREKDSAILFFRRPSSRILCTNDLIVLHSSGIFFFFFRFLVRRISFTGIELTSQRVRRLRGYL